MSKYIKDIECIWMSAGVVQYRLCDNNFDCENCPFDKAIHEKNYSEIIHTEDHSSIKLETELHPGEKVFFSDTHLWLKILSDSNTGYIGLDNFAWNLIKRFSFIKFNKEDKVLKKNNPLCWAINSEGVLTILSLSNGKIIDFNSQISKEPIDKKQSSIFHKWLIKFIIEDNLDTIIKDYTVKNYEKFIKAENMKLKEWISHNIGNFKVGQTMFDGGEIIDNFINNIDKSSYFKLCKFFLNKNKDQNNV